MHLKRPVVAVGLLAVASAALTACSETGDSASGLSGQLVAEGASSQQNAMSYFATQLAADGSGVSLEYTPSGSGAGTQNFVGGQVDFAGSDSPLTEEQVAQAKERCGSEAWHLPLVIGPVAIAYHLDGVEELTLPVATIAKIFSGEVTSWNDPEIAAANEGVELPDKKISVIYRSDESGTSDNFQKFLSATGDWDGSGKQFPAAVGSGANGSNGVASEVNSIDGAITYVEAGFAKDNENVSVAAVDFGSGSVGLDKESVGNALDKLTFESDGHDMVVDAEALFSMNEPGAYPLILTTYEIVCSDYSASGTEGADTGAMVKEFLNLALKHQDEGLEEQGFIPVTGTHHERLVAATEAIK